MWSWDSSFYTFDPSPNCSNVHFWSTFHNIESISTLNEIPYLKWGPLKWSLNYEFKKGAYLQIKRMPSRKLKDTKTFPYYDETEKYNSIAQYVTFHCPRTATGHGFLSFNSKTFRSPPIVFTNEREKKVEFKITMVTSRFIEIYRLSLDRWNTKWTRLYLNVILKFESFKAFKLYVQVRWN